MPYNNNGNSQNPNINRYIKENNKIVEIKIMSKEDIKKQEDLYKKLISLSEEIRKEKNIEFYE